MVRVLLHVADTDVCTQLFDLCIINPMSLHNVHSFIPLLHVADTDVCTEVFDLCIIIPICLHNGHGDRLLPVSFAVTIVCCLHSPHTVPHPSSGLCLHLLHRCVVSRSIHMQQS